MRYFGFVLVCLIGLACSISVCTPLPNEAVPSVQTPQISQELALEFVITKGGVPVVRGHGSPFEVTRDNCGVTTDSQAGFKQTRQFTVVAALDVPQAVSELFGGRKAAEETLLAELQGAPDLHLGESRSAEGNLEFVVPPNSKQTVHFRWESTWIPGTIRIDSADGGHIGEVSFAVVDTAQLVKLDEETISCNGDVAPGSKDLFQDTPFPPTLEPLPAPNSIAYDGEGFVWAWAGEDMVGDEDWYFDIKFYHNVSSELFYDAIVAEPMATEHVDGKWRFIYPGMIDFKCGSFWTVQIARQDPNGSFAGFLSPESERLPTGEACD